MMDKSGYILILTTLAIMLIFSQVQAKEAFCNAKGECATELTQDEQFKAILAEIKK